MSPWLKGWKRKKRTQNTPPKNLSPMTMLVEKRREYELPKGLRGQGFGGGKKGKRTSEKPQLTEVGYLANNQKPTIW